MPATGATTGPLVDDDGGTRLQGARCATCDTHVFPAQGTCPRCGSDLTPTALAGDGTIWSWTVQRIAPKAPYRAGGDEFEPFALAYVDLGPVLVEAPLSGRPVDAWQIGDAVRLVTGADDRHPGWRYWFEAVNR
jgi:uncharacterized OB-fold protein